VVHRELGDRWQLAVAPDHLAAALDHMEETQGCCVVG
jgi:hypothetical protein